jgi:GAF domain-containing protein
LKRPHRKRYFSLQATITIVMIVFGIVASAIITLLLYVNFSAQVREDLRLRLRNIADITALQMNPDELATVVDKADMENEVYVRYQRKLSEIINSGADIINIYTMRKKEDGKIYFYMDAGDLSYTPDPPGEVAYEKPSDLLLEVFALPSGTVVEKNIYTDEYGSVISAYVPLYKQDGNLESILALDMKADTVIQAEQNILKTTLVYFGISLPFIVLLAIYFGYLISRPSNSLSKVAQQIAQSTEWKTLSIPLDAAGNSSEAAGLIQTYNLISQRLNNVIQDLEQRVVERTTDLKAASALSEKRARQFEAITLVSKDIISIQGLVDLLPRISQVISEQFGFYHVGIFLTDTHGEYAVLSAANSEGGKKMIQRHHQLKIGEQGIVGYVTQTGKPRIALDVGEDAVYFTNPELPGTHSEMALPLKAGSNVIGALDIQSTQVGAFTNEDFQTLSALADQVSLAIQNARHFEQSKKSLAELEAIQRQYVHETWERLPQEEKLAGYRYSVTGAVPLTPEEVETAKNTQSKRHEVSTPIILRGEIIGTLTVQSPTDEYVNQDQMDLIRAVAERVAISAENARLFDETVRRAEREHLVADITTKIRSATDPQEMINTAVEELRRALKAKRIEIVPGKPHPPQPDKNLLEEDNHV